MKAVTPNLDEDPLGTVVAPKTSRTRRSGRTGGAGSAMAATIALVAGAVAVSGCGVINTITKAVDTIEANRTIIKDFSKNLKSGEKVTFEATYVTTGSSPVTVIYAVKPPTEVAFEETATGAGQGGAGQGDSDNYDMLANNSGGYSCSPGSATTSAATPGNSTSANGPGWSCTKLGDAKQVLSSGLVDIYTPAHWVAFLDVVAIAAGLAGDSVTSSTRVVNGFDMNCVNLRASGVKGTSTICTTSQGVLGYVKVADDSTSFEIKSYSSTPTASLFQLPAGATLTTPQVTTATT